MTAEIGIMNRLGIALAADSAVSLGESRKIYTSAEKLFQLSFTAPVGAMVYGNANLVSTPWETIIKSYRRHIGKSVSSSLEEYADSLVSYLRRTRGMFSPTRQREEILILLEIRYREIRGRIEKAVLAMTKSKAEVKEGEVKEKVASIIKESLDQLRSHEKLQGELGGIRKPTREWMKIQIADLRKRVFQKLPMTSAAIRNLEALAWETLGRSHPGPFSTGIAVAGFGE